MATSTFSCAPTNATDAQFRAWGGGLSAAMTAVGFTKTSDTGQVDWTTVLAPVSAGVYQGYEIRQFSDGATPACVVKVEYGSLSAASNPSLRLTFGTGSNGSGTITGGTGAVTTPNVAASGTSFNCYVCGDGSFLAFSMWPSNTPTSNWMNIVIDRTRNADGTANTDGLLVLFPTATNVATSYSYSRSLNAWTTTNNPPAFMPQPGLTGVSGSDVYLSGYYPAIGGKVESPSVAAVCYWRGDFTLGTPITANPGNGSKTWLPVGGAGWDVRAAAGGTQALAIRWN